MFFSGTGLPEVVIDNGPLTTTEIETASVTCKQKGFDLRLYT